MSEATRILVADDNRDHALLAVDALESCGHDLEVRVAYDGAEALRVVQEEGWIPHLVLLDVQMPILDGFEVLERLKADLATNPIPVVMLTSSADEREICRAYGLGTTNFVTKPIGVQALRELVSRIPSYWSGVPTPAAPEVNR